MQKGADVYAHLLNWPTKDIVVLSDPIASASTKVTMLGLAQPLSWVPEKSGLQVNFKDIRPSEIPCKDAWVLKLQGVK